MSRCSSVVHLLKQDVDVASSTWAMNVASSLSVFLVRWPRGWKVTDCLQRPLQCPDSSHAKTFSPRVNDPRVDSSALLIRSDVCSRYGAVCLRYGSTSRYDHTFMPQKNTSCTVMNPVNWERVCMTGDDSSSESVAGRQLKMSMMHVFRIIDVPVRYESGSTLTVESRLLFDREGISCG